MSSNGEPINIENVASVSKNKIEADVNLLSSSLAQDLGTEGMSIGELLESLNNVDGIAQDVEGKLDGLLDNLDSLLATLEGQGEGELKAGEKLPLQTTALDVPVGK